MPSTKKALPERRQNSHKMLEDFVNERTQMLSLYGELATRHPFNDTDSISDLLEQFCQSLIDYTADAHFRLYRFIDERKERRGSVLEIADKVYPKIIATTQSILDFNDKYDLEDHSSLLSALKKDLSRLGEDLAERIEMEDQVIKVLGAERSGRMN